jgi:uncharacterized protein (TIGR03382 family)
MTRRNLLSAALITMAGAPAFASDQNGTTYDQWKEELTNPDPVLHGNPDAGDMPATANLTRGEGGLNKITGQFVRTDDADMYCIRILDPMTFSATTTGAGNSSDTNLALFTLSGVGITFNDNATSSTTRSTITGQFVPSPGLYMLVISRNDVGFGGATFTRPLNSLGDLIFPGPAQGVNGTPRVGEFQPTVAGDALAGWETAAGFQLFNATYSIALTGADYHMLPAPGTAALLGLGGLVGLRRRR